MKNRTVIISTGQDYSKAQNPVSTLLIPPIGALAMASFLKKHEIPVELIDLQLDFGIGLSENSNTKIHQKLIKHLEKSKDSISWIGVSQTSDIGNGITVARKINSVLPEIPIIFGSYAATGSFKSWLRDYHFITAIVLGDGESAALAISRRLERGESILSERVPNLAWRDGEEIRTSVRRSVSPSELPILDFQLIHNPKYYQNIAIISSRGCPFHCNYCLENNMRSYAPYPISWVTRQLEHIKTHLNQDRLCIYDPIFGVEDERTRKLCRILKKYHFKYLLESRCDVLEPDILPLLKDSGVEILYLGLESACPATLVRMDKAASLGQAEDYIKNGLNIMRACFENDITPVFGFMINFPGENEVDYRLNLEFVKQVERIHEEVTSQTGIMTGFIGMTNDTILYPGSPLTKKIRPPADHIAEEKAVNGEDPGRSKKTNSNAFRIFRDAIRFYYTRQTPVAIKRGSVHP